MVLLRRRRCGAVTLSCVGSDGALLETPFLLAEVRQTTFGPPAGPTPPVPQQRLLLLLLHPVVLPLEIVDF